MAKNRNTTANTPASKKSAADAFNDMEEQQFGVRPPAEKLPPSNKSAAELMQGFEDSEPQSQELREMMTPNLDAQAERATKEDLIGGFDFNYEYMGGENYMSDDLKESQAQRQPGVDKLKRGLNRFAGEFALNVMETPGILVGAGAALVTGDINKMTDNFWVRGAEEMKKALHEANPVYSQRAIREGGVWDKMSSGEWIATEGASALAFMASALVPGMAINKGAKALGLMRALSKGNKFTQGAVRGVDEALSKIPGVSADGLGTLGSVTGNMASQVTVTMANTVFEAGIEAMGAQKAFVHGLETKYRNGEISAEELAENLKYADTTAMKTFQWNNALLLVPNMIMTKAMLGPTPHTLAKAHKNIKLSEAGRWIKGGAKNAPTTKLGKLANAGPVQAAGKMASGFTKNTFREGVVEEMGQMTIEKYHSEEYMESLLSGNDKRNWAETYAEVLGSTDGQIAALTGGIISAPMSMRSRYLEGKQLRAQADNAVNNYNGVQNYYGASRQDFYELNEDGTRVIEGTNEDGSPKFKVDQTKIADLADAKEEVDRLNLVKQAFMEDGEYDKAAAVAARLQAGAFGAYLQTGPEGLKALKEFMEQSPATQAGVNAYNLENTKQITLSEFVNKEMDKATKMAEDMKFYETKVSAPLTSSWEKENGVIPGTPEGDAISAQRAQFERNYRQSYMESGAVIEELKTRLDQAKSDVTSMESEGKDATLIMREEKRVDDLELQWAKANIARLDLESPTKFEERWDRFYAKQVKAAKINSGEMVYELDDAIASIKQATTTKEIRLAVDDAIEKGLILPYVDKAKLPAILNELTQTGNIHEALTALAIYQVHHDVTEEEKGKIANKIQQSIMEQSINPMDEQEAQEEAARQWAEAQAAADQTDAEFQEDAENPTEEVEFPGEEAPATITPNPEAETYKGIPVQVSDNIVTAEGTQGAAQYTPSGILVNRELLRTKYEEKAWTKPRHLKDGTYAAPLPADTFSTYEQFEQFVMEHERQHSLYTRAQYDAKHNNEGTLGGYESEINDLALEELGIDNVVEPSTLEILSAIEVNRPAKPQSKSNTFVWLTEATPLNEYYSKLAELVQLVKDKKHTDETIDHIFIALKHNNQLGDAILSIAPNFTRAMGIRGVGAWEQWKEYINEKEVTDADITDAKVERIDTGYDTPVGVQAELARLIKAQRSKIKAKAVQARIDAFNKTLKEKGRAWADIAKDNKLIKTGTEVFWKGLNSKNFKGTVRSIIKGADKNGTNVLVEDASGNLHVVNAAGLHAQSLDTRAENTVLNKRHQAKSDKEKKTIEKGKEAYARIGVRSDGHPRVVSVGPVKAEDPTIKGKFMDVYNAFLRYLEEPRNKTKDRIEFSLNEKLLKGQIFEDSQGGAIKEGLENSEELQKAFAAFTKAKAGEALSTAEVASLVDYMPMSLRAFRSEGNGSAGAYMRTASGPNDVEFQRIERPIREKIINEWIIAGSKLGTKHEMGGVTANWGFQYTGDINVDDNLQEGGNRVDNLKGVTLENMNIFAVGSKESNEVIAKNGDRTKVPADLIEKTGGIFITVKDNNGKDSHIRLRNNTLAGSAELDMIMMMVEELLIGNVQMNMPITSEMSELMENEMPQLYKVFKETPTVGALYNTLVYKGADASQLGTVIDPLTRTFSIGVDQWTAEEFMENKDTVKGMLGLKFKNVNFPSADQYKNKLPSTGNIDYLTYIMETKVLATNLKEDQALFVGKPDPNNPNYMGGINPYMSPKEIRSETKVQKAKKTIARKAGTVKKDAIKLGSRLVEKLRKAGYDPAKLSQSSIEFLKGIAKKRGVAFTQAIEDYNNRIVAADDKAGDNVIKKCKG